MTQKRKSKGKFVSAVLGLVVLVGGLGAGIVLVQQSQTITPLAYDPAPNPSTVCNVNKTRCSTDGKSVEECLKGESIWTKISCPNGCETVNGLSKCKINTTTSNVYCDISLLGLSNKIACPSGGYKTGICTKSTIFYYWKYGQCVISPIQLGKDEPIYPNGRNMKCTYNYDKSADILYVVNPSTTKVVPVNRFSKQNGDELGSTPCSNNDIGRVEVFDYNNDTNSDLRTCLPININGCGNIGTWFVNYNYTPTITRANLKYSIDKQYFQCSKSSECQSEFGDFYVCDYDRNRCALNLERQACSGYKGQISCEGAYYYNANGTKHSCEWYPGSDGFTCDTTVDAYTR